MIEPVENQSLANLNTFHVEAASRYYLELYNVDDIRQFTASAWNRKGLKLILGGGSNVLFTKNFDGLIIRPRITGIEKTGETADTVFIRAGAGEEWDRLVEYCVNKNLGGLENLSLIPGTAGASPVQNIGAYGTEVSDVLVKVEAIELDSGNEIILDTNDCRFSYRNSIFKQELKNRVIITHVTFRLSKNHRFNTAYPGLQKELDNYPETTIQNIRKAVIKLRRDKLPDPAEIGNAGSFFKNPVITGDQLSFLRTSFPDIPSYDAAPGLVKLSAAWLIEQSGWKGKRLGMTGTYNKQPLIVINYGNATGMEIFECALQIQRAVMNRFALQLDMEVNII